MANNEYHLTSSVTYMPYTFIPRYLIDLSKLKTSDEKRLKLQVHQIVKKYPDLYHVIELMHPENERPHLFEVVNTYNFDHFMELIISSLIEKKVTGNYLKKCDLGHAIRIDKLYQKLRPHSLSSSPRILLLFLYLTFISIERYGIEHVDEYCKNLIKFTADYTSLINTNIYEIDWMLLSLYLTHESIGRKSMTHHLESATIFSDIISTISYQDKKTIFTSLINYANSIDEEHLLLQDYI